VRNAYGNTDGNAGNTDADGNADCNRNGNCNADGQPDAMRCDTDRRL
jgi:hypothetical protein